MDDRLRDKLHDVALETAGAITLHDLLNEFIDAWLDVKHGAARDADRQAADVRAQFNRVK